MSTATATQGDDLIILSDNINSTFGNEPIVSEDLNFGENNSVISFDSPVITPDSSVVDVNNSPITLESPLNLDSNVLVDNPITISETTETDTIESPIEEKKEMDNSISNLFGEINKENTITISNQNDSEEASISIEETDDGDMNSILNSTIARLKKRQSGIASQKSDKTSRIIELERQIKELRDQVIMLKKEIVFLDDENIKIEINVGNLESMKIGKQSKVNNKPARAHNTKKLTK
ncbi:hypothetical protein EOM39_03490 [Candidatus Gracilibacteria bacterium]|nr:hypothetical protein [Candidatus Gracilibacteria bacterium]